MYNYIQNMLDELPLEIQSIARTLAVSHQFDLNPEGKKLNVERAQLFHHIVAKLLYLC